MAAQHVVVDGSNIATEGRSTPSLAQLESALEELHREMPDAVVTVVVDATFAHRIDPSELPRFEEASLRGEYVSPPAGAIGRGDAFLLRIAEKVDATVLSNDSFQEFHAEHEWLFDRGRLLGATPVPGVGWILIPRVPVRGPRSRVVTRDSARAKARVSKAIAAATKEVVEPEKVDGAGTKAKRTPRRSTPPPQAVNEPMPFISFIAEHPLGDEVEGEVGAFTSHGASVRVGDVLCYVPLAGLGEPPPRSARSVLSRGERRVFVITALDPVRRGVELALPGVRSVSGRPSEEMVEAEVRLARTPKKRPAAAKAASRRRSPTAEPTGDEAKAHPEPPAPKAPARARARAKAGATSGPTDEVVQPGSPDSEPPRKGRSRGSKTAEGPESSAAQPAKRVKATKKAQSAPAKRRSRAKPESSTATSAPGESNEKDSEGAGVRGLTVAEGARA